MAFDDAKKQGTLCVVQVVRTIPVSPNLRRVTLGGEQLAALTEHGFDHWFRLFLPHEHGETSFDLPDRFDLRSYMRYLRMPAAVRPHLRNYTVRAFRPDQLELDVDFVVHGDEGIATRWATRTLPGDTVALIDQGRGFDPADDVAATLLVGDETALPAIAGILRDLPRDARGTAVVEIPDADDAQSTDAPDGFDVRFVVRPHGARPGVTALDEFTALPLAPRDVAAFCVGEQSLAAGARRHLVAAGVPKTRIAFTGYWKAPKQRA